MENPENNLIVSIASLWEIAIKMGLGKLTLSGDISVIIEKMTANGFDLMPIEPEHLVTLADLPAIHRDPFDRILISQAITAGIPIVSSDDTIAEYPVERIWH
jgi:PIN domain nuclease of toxin-antitoxin system